LEGDEEGAEVDFEAGERVSVILHETRRTRI
jgi:hypothetical protein